MNKNTITQFWEQKFIEEETSWGFKPADSAIIAKDLFLQKGIKNVLIPGIGYGRNAKIFIENGIKVAGIEISGKAIDLAKSVSGLDIKIHHGSVMEMPFDNEIYEGVFCYALVHLLNQRERRKLLNDCYEQLRPGGIMVFTVVSTKASMYGTGKLLSKDRFQIGSGLSVFFYDGETIEKEYKNFGLQKYYELDEPIKHLPDEPPLKCYIIICSKT